MLKRLGDALRRRLQPRRRPVIWEGVYSDFGAVPVRGAGFHAAEAVEAAGRLLREAESSELPREAVTDHETLVLALRLTQAGVVSVVDFGGGVGHSYRVLKRLMPGQTMRFNVIDLPPLVERGRELWRNDPGIAFSDHADVAVSAPDVVFSKSVLQYFPDYDAQFRRLLAAGASWVVLEKLPALQSEEFVTGQVNVYDSVVPYWFMSADRLTRSAEQCGYRLVLQRRLEREYDQWNFPPHLRMGRAMSLVFERVAS